MTKPKQLNHYMQEQISQKEKATCMKQVWSISVSMATCSRR